MLFRCCPVDQDHYYSCDQIKDCIDRHNKGHSVLINNNECVQEVKQQMDDSTIDQIPMLSENISHNNAYTYDCPHEGNCIYYQIQRR